MIGIQRCLWLIEVWGKISGAFKEIGFPQIKVSGENNQVLRNQWP